MASRRDDARALLADLEDRDEPVPIRRALTSDPAVQPSKPEAPKESKADKVPTRRQTVDFEIPEHNRLKRLAMEHNTNVSHLIRMVMRTVDDERIGQILND